MNTDTTTTTDFTAPAAYIPGTVLKKVLQATLRAIDLDPMNAPTLHSMHVALSAGQVTFSATDRHLILATTISELDTPRAEDIYATAVSSRMIKPLIAALTAKTVAFMEITEDNDVRFTLYHDSREEDVITLEALEQNYPPLETFVKPGNPAPSPDVMGVSVKTMLNLVNAAKTLGYTTIDFTPRAQKPVHFVGVGDYNRPKALENVALSGVFMATKVVNGELREEGLKDIPVGHISSRVASN